MTSPIEKPARCDSTEVLGRLSPSEQQQLTEILDQYLQQIENGEVPDPDKLLAEHPHWHEVLQRYLESLGVLHFAARGMQSEQMEDAASGPDQVDPLADAAASLANERRLGDYLIRRQIGRGGMGIVYEAHQVSLDRRVALKVLPLAAVLDQRQIARFRREAQAAAQLHHPNIVPVFGVGCESGVHFYSMQLVDGQSIDRVLDSIQSDADATRVMSGNSMTASTTVLDRAGTTINESPRPAEVSASHSVHSVSGSTSVCNRTYIDRVAELGIQAAQALQHAHEYGVIHRDIKPSNLMLDREGKLWITDFGLAHIQSETDMTATGDLVGTLRYMSPEQASGTGVIDQRTDIYSLGITLYEMLTLRQAITSRERGKLLRDIEAHEPRRPRKINPSIPRDLETIILKAISKERDQRYAHAGEFADDLRRYLDGKPTLARRPTLIDLGTKWAFRHRAVVACLMLTLVLALAGTSAALFFIQRQQIQTDIARKETVAENEKAERNLRLANAQRRQAISTLEKINRLSRRLTQQPGVQRQIQIETRQLYREFVAAANDGNTTFIEFAQTHHRVAVLSEQLGDFEAAIESYESAAKAYAELCKSDPTQRLPAAVNMNNLGRAFARVGRRSEATTWYGRALEQLENIKDPAEIDLFVERDVEIARAAALVTGNRGLLSWKSGDLVTAEACFADAIAQQTEIHGANADNVNDSIRLAANYHNLGSMLVDSDPTRARELCEKAIELHEEIVARRPEDIHPRVDLAIIWNNMGSIELRSDRFQQAIVHYQKGSRCWPPPRSQGARTTATSSRPRNQLQQSGSRFRGDGRSLWRPRVIS